MNAYALPEHHVVTVTIETDEDDWSALDGVTCVCTAPHSAPCRTYPRCDCETFRYDPDNPGHDEAGHPFENSRDCWVIGWFDPPFGESTTYVGSDATDATDCGLPLVAQHGHINAISADDHNGLEWEWHGEPRPLDVSLDQGELLTEAEQ